MPREARLVTIDSGQKPKIDTAHNPTLYVVGKRKIDGNGHLNNSGAPEITAEARQGIETPGLQVAAMSISYKREIFAGDTLSTATQLYPSTSDSEVLHQSVQRGNELVLLQTTRRAFDLSNFSHDSFPAFSLEGKAQAKNLVSQVKLPTPESESSGQHIEHPDYLPVFENQRHEVLKRTGVTFEEIYKTGLAIVISEIDMAFGRYFTTGEEVTITTKTALDRKLGMGYLGITFVQRMQGKNSPHSIIQLSRCVIIDRNSTRLITLLPKALEQKLLEAN